MSFEKQMIFKEKYPSNILNTSASVLPGFPNTRKLIVFEMASQSAPNCKQKKKRKQKSGRTQKSQACDFCLLLFNQRTVCDDNVRVFH